MCIQELGTNPFTKAIQWVEPAKPKLCWLLVIANAANEPTDWQRLKSQRCYDLVDPTPLKTSTPPAAPALVTALAQGHFTCNQNSRWEGRFWQSQTLSRHKG
ncbi:hypothetical protein MITS9509_00361 [Synechococcus sp. MIT S9509]|nr:hypothetical protein MITS9509_00361 [Synechococcus sp. MIT S9509]